MTKVWESGRQTRISGTKKGSWRQAKSLDLMLYAAMYCGRGERIRTSDSCVPNAVLYQAELRPDRNNDSAKKT